MHISHLSTYIGNSQQINLLYSDIPDGDCSHEIKRPLLLGRKVMTNLRQHIKKQTHYFANKGQSFQSYDFSSSHVRM